MNTVVYISYFNHHFIHVHGLSIKTVLTKPVTNQARLLALIEMSAMTLTIMLMLRVEHLLLLIEQQRSICSLLHLGCRASDPGAVIHDDP